MTGLSACRTEWLAHRAGAVSPPQVSVCVPRHLHPGNGEQHVLVCLFPHVGDLHGARHFCLLLPGMCVAAVCVLPLLTVASPSAHRGMPCRAQTYRHPTPIDIIRERVKLGHTEDIEGLIPEGPRPASSGSGTGYVDFAAEHEGRKLFPRSGTITRESIKMQERDPRPVGRAQGSVASSIVIAEL